MTDTRVIVRAVKPQGRVPKGKKLIVVAGVFVVDDNTPTEVSYEARLTYQGILTGMKATPLPGKYKSWTMETVLPDFAWGRGVAKPESTRNVEFSKVLDNALKHIGHGGLTKDKAKELLVQVKEVSKHVHCDDFGLSTVINSITSILERIAK